MDGVVALWRHALVDEARHGHEDDVSLRFDAIGGVPVPYHGPLRREVRGGLCGESLGADARVKVYEAATSDVKNHYIVGDAPSLLLTF